MSISKRLLFQKLESLVNRKYNGWDKIILIQLIQQIVMNDPTIGCIVKGRRTDWDGLPKSKSLFFAPKDCGLPIGNSLKKPCQNLQHTTPALMTMFQKLK